MTLTEFLLARIAEDEAEARDVKAIDDDVTTDSALFTNDHHHYGFNVGYSATRALAECEAKRRMIDWWMAGRIGDEGHDTRRLLGALALPYATHPDYDQSWAV